MALKYPLTYQGALAALNDPSISSEEWVRTWGPVYEAGKYPLYEPGPIPVSNNWRTILTANSAQEVESGQVQPTIDELPAGTPVKVHIELADWAAPFGKLTDLAGAEWWAPRLAEVDLDVTDVYGTWGSFTIEGTARGMAVMTALVAIVSALAALGIVYFVTSMLMEASIAEQKKADTLNRLIDEGYSPEEASRAVEKLEVEPTLPELPSPAGLGIGIGTLALIALGLYLVTRR